MRGLTPIAALFFLIYVASAKTIYISPADSIQEAIDAAAPGDVIVLADGIYNESLKINKRVTIRAENVSGATIQSVNVTASGVVLDGIAINTTAVGVLVNDSQDCTIINSRISGGIGIILNSSTCRIVGCEVYGIWGGIYLLASRGNEIVNSTILGLLGVYLNESDGNVIYSSHIEGALVGLALNFSNRNGVLRSNVSGGFVGVSFSHSNGNTLNDSVVSSLVAIDLQSSDDNTISGNSASGNLTGVSLSFSNRNGLKENDIYGGWVGINLNTSNRNLIVNNVISSDLTGLSLTNSAGNEIYLNNILAEFSVYLNGSGTNVWNSTEIIEYWYDGKRVGYMGNYYGDYECADSDGDGVCDSPRVIGKDNIDEHPLVQEWQLYFETAETIKARILELILEYIMNGGEELKQQILRLIVEYMLLCR